MSQNGHAHATKNGHLEKGIAYRVPGFPCPEIESSPKELGGDPDNLLWILAENGEELDAIFLRWDLPVGEDGVPFERVGVKIPLRKFSGRVLTPAGVCGRCAT